MLIEYITQIVECSAMSELLYINNIQYRINAICILYISGTINTINYCYYYYHYITINISPHSTKQEEQRQLCLFCRVKRNFYKTVLVKKCS